MGRLNNCNREKRRRKVGLLPFEMKAQRRHTERRNNPNTGKAKRRPYYTDADGPFVVEVLHSLTLCWLCQMQGDPGRTLFLPAAKRWKRISDALKALARVRRDYPRRGYRVTTFWDALEMEAKQFHKSC